MIQGSPFQEFTLETHRHYGKVHTQGYSSPRHLHLQDVRNYGTGHPQKSHSGAHTRGSACVWKRRRHAGGRPRPPAHRSHRNEPRKRKTRDSESKGRSPREVSRDLSTWKETARPGADSPAGRILLGMTQLRSLGNQQGSAVRPQQGTHWGAVPSPWKAASLSAAVLLTETVEPAGGGGRSQWWTDCSLTFLSCCSCDAGEGGPARPPPSHI